MRILPQKLRWILWGLLVAAGFLMLWDGSQIVTVVKSVRTALFPSNGLISEDRQSILIRNLDKEARLFLQGDPTQPTEDLRWKALHLSEPEDPALYWIYILNRGSLPDDYRETVNRIAPENGWFDLVEAASLSKEVVSVHKLGRRRRGEGEMPKAKRYKIANLSQLKEAIALLENAASKPEYNDYREIVAKRRSSYLPRANGFFDLIRNVTFEASAASSVSFEKKFSEASSAWLQHLIAKEDKEGFLKHEKVMNTLSQRNLEMSGDILSLLVSRAVIFTNAIQLSNAASKLGLLEKAQHYQEMAEAFHADKIEIRKTTGDEMRSLLESHGSYLSYLSTPSVGRIVKDVPKVSLDDLRPATRAEHAFAGRLLATKFFFLFLFGSLVMLIARFSRPAEERDSDLEMLQESLSTAVWLRIFGLGSLVPFLFFLIIRFWTPLGQLEYGIGQMQVTHYYIPFFAVLLLIIVSSLVVVRYETARLTGEDWSKKSALIIACPLLSLLSIGLLLSLDIPKIDGAAALFLWVTVLWMLALLARSSFVNSSQTPRRELIKLALIPLFLFSAVLMAFASKAFAMEERYWFSKDTFSQPADGFLTGYERKVAEVAKGELEMLLDATRDEIPAD